MYVQSLIQLLLTIRRVAELKKLRLALNKGEELRFLSHLDYAQAVERMIRRAEIKWRILKGLTLT